MANKGTYTTEWGTHGDQVSVVLEGQRWPYRLTYAMGDPSLGQFWTRYYVRWVSAQLDYHEITLCVDTVVSSIQRELEAT